MGLVLWSASSGRRRLRYSRCATWAAPSERSIRCRPGRPRGYAAGDHVGVEGDVEAVAWADRSSSSLTVPRPVEARRLYTTQPLPWPAITWRY